MYGIFNVYPFALIYYGKLTNQYGKDVYITVSVHGHRGHCDVMFTCDATVSTQLGNFPNIDQFLDYSFNGPIQNVRTRDTHDKVR